MYRSDYTMIKKLFIPIWICLSICLVAAGCNSSEKDDPVKNMLDAADLAAKQNKEMTDYSARKIQELENEQNEGEVTEAEKASRFEEGPRNVPFGGSKGFELDVQRPFSPLGGDTHYTEIRFALPECLTSAGIRVWFGNSSEGEKSDQLTYWVSIDDPGEGGYQAFQNSIKTCNATIPMALMSEGEKTVQRGATPMLLKLTFSKYGVHVNEPTFVH